MTSPDPSLEPAIPTSVDRDRRARAGQILSDLLCAPSCTGGAVVHVDTDPSIVLRMGDLTHASWAAAFLDLTWHTQATGGGAGALWVHAFEGVLEGFPVTVYAIGERDPDPVVGTVEGTASLAMLLGGLIL